ncbi:Lrp/AsnC family transcriptional regulator [Pelagimonas varians]|uniref:Leucine-responsive regulatory protein n=1 Tax=Pelagimonas varians TaxID=696760 RepID=A0A238KTY1_9RHOB|nr:Lrp/AsnC family transcriptional regulator [Pelagimonas varians]PYG28248.1 AsnC family transcriptional regulator [Pelagimonas varians]SMX46314.1 Leucine-responsive regulatory protein [Pelagimonas varians]
MQTDEIDMKLISLLSENARLPVADLSRRLGIARTTVQARIDRLQDRGAIAGFTLRKGASLRPAVRATALLSIEPRAAAAVIARLKTLPQVETVHTTSGRFDLIVILSAQTTEELDERLDDIRDAQGVKTSESLIHLSTKIDRAG